MGYSAANLHELGDQLRNLSAKKKEQSVCDWVEQNVEIPAGEITGKVKLSMTPYAKEILNRFGDKETRHLVLKFPTQSAKTSILIWGGLYWIACNPRDTMWIMGNSDQITGFNKERMMPAVALCKPVLDLVPRTPKGQIDRHWWGVNNQHYSSMVLNFLGAGSGTNLKSRPRERAIMDEVDSYADELGRDSGVINLVEERMKSFTFPCSVKASSPTVDGMLISAEYDKTDRREFWLPCPRCEEAILFRFRIKSDKHGDCGLRWWFNHEDDAKTDGAWDFKKIRSNAHYKCQQCGGMIHNFERKDMLNHAADNKPYGWRPSNEGAEKGRFGYHLNSLYSILGAPTSFAGIACQWIISKGNRGNLKSFINDWLAEGWDESKAYDFQEVKLSVFQPADIPEDSVAIMAIDVQEVGYWYVVRKFQRPDATFLHGQSWLLDAGFVGTIEELDEKQREYNIAGENITMDMAHRPNQVGRMIIERGWKGMWGSDTRKFQHTINGQRYWRPFSVPQFRDPMLGTSWENRTPQRAVFCFFSTHEALDMVSSLRFAKETIWHCTVNTHPDYGAHLNSKVKRQEINSRGKAEWRWHEVKGRPDHLLDCECHVTIRAMQLGLLSLPNETERQNVQ